MNGQAWSTIGVICGILFGAITLYFVARSSSNETQRRSDAAVEKAKKDGKDEGKAESQPTIDALKLTVTAHEATITRLYGRLDIKDRRIEELEDQLRIATRGSS